MPTVAYPSDTKLSHLQNRGGVGWSGMLAKQTTIADIANGAVVLYEIVCLPTSRRWVGVSSNFLLDRNTKLHWLQQPAVKSSSNIFINYPLLQEEVEQFGTEYFSFRIVKVLPPMSGVEMKAVRDEHIKKTRNLYPLVGKRKLNPKFVLNPEVIAYRKQWHDMIALRDTAKARGESRIEVLEMTAEIERIRQKALALPQRIQVQY